MGSADYDNKTKTPRRGEAKRTRDDAIRRYLLRINELIERSLDLVYAVPEASPRVEIGFAAHGDPLPTAQNLHLERTRKGGTIALIDGKRVALTPALAALIAILASGEGQAAGDLVSFKSFDLIAGLLGNQSGRSVSRRAVIQRLSRLRETLKTAGLDDRVIETSGAGVRLRLKRCQSVCE